MNKYKISVIIPVYNGANFITNGLDCILSQTLKDIEIIVINDCSTDNTLEILEKYQCLENIKIVTNPKNLGPGLSRNKGIELASGEYVHFFDSDDLLENENFYEKLYNIAIKNDLDMIFFSFTSKYFDTKEFVKNTHFKYPENVISFSVEDKNKFMIEGIFSCNKLLKLTFIKEKNIKFPLYELGEDIYFHWISIIQAEKLMYIKDCYYTYLIRSDSLTRKKLGYERFQNVIGVFESMKDFLIDKGYYKIYEKEFVLFYLRKYCNLYKFSKFDNKKIFKQISDKVSWIQLSKYNFPKKYFKFVALQRNNYYLFNLLNLDFKKVFSPK